METKDIYLQRFETIIARIRENMTAIPDDRPEKAVMAENLEEMLRIVRKYLG